MATDDARDNGGEGAWSRSHSVAGVAPAPVDAGLEHELVGELALQGIRGAAPDEEWLFESTRDAYFRDPRKVMRADASSGDTLGFGLDVGPAIVAITPIALEVATSVVRYAASLVGSAVRDEAAPRLRALVRQLLKASATNASTPDAPQLTREQFEEIRRVAVETATNLHLSQDRAALLADAMIGRLAA